MSPCALTCPYIISLDIINLNVQKISVV